MKQNRYILACILPFLLPYSVFCDKSTQQYLTEGNAYLTSGEFNNALTSFDAAIRKLNMKKKVFYCTCILTYSWGGFLRRRA